MSDASISRKILLLGDARQVHLVRWASYLAAHGYDPLVISLEPTSAIRVPCRRIRVSNALPHFIRYPLAVPAVKSAIRSFKPDLVNAHFVPNYGVIAAMARSHPWVLSTWGSDIMILPEKSPFHDWRTRRVIASADAITSDAVVMSDKLVALGAPADEVITVPYGVDRSEFHGSGDHWSTEGPRIISNRKHEEVYSIGTIIQAFNRVRKQHAQATLTVGGSGSLSKDLRGSAQAGGYLHSIEFVGDIAHGDMAGLLRRNDLYVSMAISDTTSVSLLEALACGLFPVVSDIAANREWIQDGVNGRLVPVQDAQALADTILASWDDPSLRAAAAAQNAVVIRDRADWNDNMAIVTGLFDRLISRSA